MLVLRILGLRLRNGVRVGHVVCVATAVLGASDAMRFPVVRHRTRAGATHLADVWERRFAPGGQKPQAGDERKRA